MHDDKMSFSFKIIIHRLKRLLTFDHSIFKLIGQTQVHREVNRVTL